MFTPPVHAARVRNSGFSARSARRARPRFRPHLEVLEDRALPSTVAYQVPAGTVGQQFFSGPLGMDFDVGKNIVVDQLGVFDSGSDGLAVPLTVRLYNRDNTTTPVASLDFPAGKTGTLIDGSRFQVLATPVVLPAEFHGSIVAEGYGPLEPNGNAGFFTPPIPPWTTNDGGGLLQFVGSGRFGSTPGAFPTNVDSGPANRYAAGTFDYFAQQQSQTITFGPLADQTLGVGPITLSATASSGLPVTFSVISGPATVSGNVLTITGTGTVTVEASQPGNGTFAAATPVDQSFIVFTPSQSTANLQAEADGAGLAQGLQNSVDSQLQEAIALFEAGDTTDAASQLGAFINHVSAQSGKGISTALASQWIASAQQIISAVS